MATHSSVLAWRIPGMGLHRVGHDWSDLAVAADTYFPVRVKNPPTMQETQVWSLGWEDPLEKEMATRSSILAWKIPWMKGPGGLQSVHGVAKNWTWLSNRALLSHKKEWIWVSSNELDKLRACYTEWSKSEREKQISYINAYIWNIEKWYWWTYLQGSNGDADI